jgi:hypothetical protein
MWQGQDYLHVFDLSDTWLDRETSRYAREQELTIVTPVTHSIIKPQDGNLSRFT